jgi:hypothetical protein
MAQQTLNPPPFRAPFTTGDSAEKGDTPTDLVTKLQAMMVELYASKAAPIKFSSNATVGATTAAAGDLTGASNVVCNYSAVGAANLTTRTAAQMIADAGLILGQTYEVEIMNSSGGTTTLVGGTGVTITGTATMATNTARWFAVTVTGAATMTFQNLGSGAI